MNIDVSAASLKALLSCIDIDQSVCRLIDDWTQQAERECASLEVSLSVRNELLKNLQYRVGLVSDELERLLALVFAGEQAMDAAVGSVGTPRASDPTRTKLLSCVKQLRTALEISGVKMAV